MKEQRSTLSDIQKEKCGVLKPAPVTRTKMIAQALAGYAEAAEALIACFEANSPKRLYPARRMPESRIAIA